jgi:hypothetical protein
MPDLLRVAEEVAATKKPLKLTRDRKTVAILMPVGTSLSPRKKPEKTRADYEAFKSAAGGWKDVDTDRLIANIYATRRRSNRPPVNL